MHNAQCLQYVKPRAGSGVVRMDPLRFLAGCRPERGPEIPEIPEILKSVLKCPEIHQVS